MPSLPPDKTIHEDQVIGSLLAHLAAAGVRCDLVETPDRLSPSDRTHPDVTSDALIVVHGPPDPIWWAVDVMVAAAPAEHHTMLARLHDRLGPVANDCGVVIEVEGDAPDPTQTKTLVRAVVADIGRGADQGTVINGGTRATWRRPRPNEKAGFAVRAVLLPAPSPALSEQIEATIRRPLVSKATRQAARARDAGCSTAVALDAAGHEGVAQGTHWLAQYASTYRDAVHRVLLGLSHSLDAVLLRDWSGAWHLLYGVFPGFDAESEP